MIEGSETKGDEPPARWTHPRVVMTSTVLLVCIVGLGVIGQSRFAAQLAHAAPFQASAVKLRSPEAFAGIGSRKERSQALIAEAGKVILHPRCVNCHPAGDAPLQGQGDPHLPGAVRGEDGFGATAMRCATCHQAENYAPSGVPGHPKWHLAPRAMAWQNKSLTEICAQIKDPKRNGGLDLKAIQHHMAEDTLVGWGWKPGANREPVPGTQKQFGALIAAWIDTGAECPEAKRQ